MSDGREAPALEDQSRRHLPTNAIVSVIGAGFVGAMLIPGSRTGLALFLTAVAVAAAVAVADPGALPKLLPLGILALALSFMAVLRTAEWVVALDLLVALGLACVVVVEAQTWRRLFAAPLNVAAQALRVPAALVAPLLDGLRRRAGEGFGTWVRTGAVSLFLLTVFGTLFVSADAAFARLATEVLIPEVELERASLRVIVFGFVAIFSGALVLSRSAAADSAGEVAFAWRAAPGERRSLRKVEWSFPIAVLDVLFASFVVVQMAVLFGGRHHVELTPGLTYAEYARQGFFQLLAVAGLVLLVVAVVVRKVRSEVPEERRLEQGVLGLLCVLTLVVLASAWYRLGVYEDVYGLTRLRVSVYATIAWLASVFVLVMWAGARWNGSWLPRAIVTATAVGLLAFSVLSPDALIARRNVDRYETTGKMDVGYLATLSEDAIPAVADLPEPLRGCVMSEIALERGTLYNHGWTEYNLSRARARSVLERANVSPLSRDACHEVAPRF